MSATIPQELIDSLKGYENVIYRSDTEPPTLGMTESASAKELFFNFLQDGNEQADTAVFATFGDPLHPFIPPEKQVDVFNLLATYQGLVSNNFVQDAAESSFPFILAPLPVETDGIQYYNAKIAINAVCQEIQNPSLFAEQCSGIASLIPTSVICDINVVFANAVIVLRLQK
jgi:hypothetical protein